MSFYNVILDKEQINVLKRSRIQLMLDNTRKMEDILQRHLSSGDYNLSEDKNYVKVSLAIDTQTIELEYLDAVSKSTDK